MITTTVIYRLRPIRYADNAYGIAADTVSVAMPSRHYRSNPNVSWETFAREVAEQVCRAEASMHRTALRAQRLGARRTP